MGHNYLKIVRIQELPNLTFAYIGGVLHQCDFLLTLTITPDAKLHEEHES
jgi:hypothetical protein